jgi:molybdopterin molybdotransferase
MAAPELVDIEDARRMVLRSATVLPNESLALAAALGRTLAEDVSAPAAVPPFDNSAMDGFAVRSEEVQSACASAPVLLHVSDESRAGAPARSGLGNGQAVAISTGAAVPGGADAVVPLEQAQPDGERVEILAPAPPGAHIRRAGEDIGAGQVVLRAGTRLGAAELGVLGSVGRAEVRCACRPRVSVLATGDELLAPGERPRPGTVNDANSHSIPALAACAGAEVVHLARTGDELAATGAALARALHGADVAVVCGGVSVGSHDHVRAGLAAAGAHEVFWGIALKPGRPTWFGTFEGTLVFGLPGNPVSAMVTFILLVAPALRAMQGAGAPRARPTALLAHDYVKARGRAEAVRCRLRVQAASLQAEPAGPQGSHVLTSMLAADALALLPAGDERVPAGTLVEIELLRGALGGVS